MKRLSVYRMMIADFPTALRPITATESFWCALSLRLSCAPEESVLLAIVAGADGIKGKPSSEVMLVDIMVATGRGAHAPATV